MHHKMVTQTFVVGLAVLAVALAGCHEPGSDETIKMGLLMPLTGDAASLGVPAAQGARLAVAEINEDGGIDGRQIEMIEGDTQFPQTQHAVSEFERLAAEGVQFVVGALTSDASAAVKEPAADAKVVLVSPSSTRPSLTGPDHGYFFRVIANDEVQGPQGARLVYEDLGVESVVVMYQQTSYAQGLKDTFIPAFEELGGSVNGEAIAWENDPATFESKASEAVGRDPSFVWISGQAPEIANLIQALRNQGYDGQILASEAIEAASIFEAACGAVDGVMFTKAAPELSSAAYQSFVEAYRAEYDEEPGPFDAFAYDAVYVGKAAIEAIGNDGPAIKEWLEGNSVSERVTTSTIRFNSEGDITTGGYSLWEASCSDGDGSFAPRSE